MCLPHAPTFFGALYVQELKTVLKGRKLNGLFIFLFTPYHTILKQLSGALWSKICINRHVCGTQYDCVIKSYLLFWVKKLLDNGQSLTTLWADKYLRPYSCSCNDLHEGRCSWRPWNLRVLSPLALIQGEQGSVPEPDAVDPDGLFPKPSALT